MGFPLLGVMFHWLGGLASGSFYVPFRGVRNWSWETAWLIGGVFSWILAPWLLAFLLSNDLIQVLYQGLTRDTNHFVWTYLFGCLWGLGGLTFGLTVRYLGMSLGMAIALGYCSIFGTLIPPLYKGDFRDKLISSVSGNWILVGIVVSLLGIIIAGCAGVLKEKGLSERKKRESIREFSFWKGLAIATFSGIMSACMSFGLESGDSIGVMSSVSHQTDPLWHKLPVLVIVLAGGFTTNAIWCLLLNWKNRSGGEYFSTVTTHAPAHGFLNGLNVNESRSLSSSGMRVPLFRNYLFSGLAGIFWYFQFFFYTIGESKMGKYDFASWTLHMASIIIFSSLWGIFFKEWRGSSRKAFGLLLIALAILVMSTLIIGYGTYRNTIPGAH